MSNPVEHYLQIQFRNRQSPSENFFDMNLHRFALDDVQGAFAALARQRADFPKYQFRLVEVAVKLVAEDAIRDAPDLYPA